MQDSLVLEPIVSGDNDFRKFIHLEFPEGSFNTIRTIVLPEEDWLLLQEHQTNIGEIEYGRN